MVSIATLPRIYGEDTETATFARDLLAPVAGQRSGDPSDLHRRCVLGQYLGRLGHDATEQVRAAFAPFGAIEAVAACRVLQSAVVVFRAAASTAAALRGPPPAALIGQYSSVPPLGSALPLCFIESRLIKAVLYPPTATMTSAPGGAVLPTSGAAISTQATPGSGPVESRIMWAGMQEMPQPRPLIEFRNSPDEGPVIPGRGPPGTTRFVPSMDSLVHGSTTVGADGHLWMHGHNVTFFNEGFSVDQASIRVIQADTSESTTSAVDPKSVVFLPL